MAHEITSTDNLVLTRNPAWHGLGTLVQDAPSPLEALEIAKLNWSVEQWPLVARKEANERAVHSHVLNVRSDSNQILGVVGVGYRPVQNRELAEFVAALGAENNVKIESAGSIRGGQRVWFLAQGRSVWANDSDEIKPYLLVANGHDGTMAVTCQPTTIRVVCKNTLHASLSEGEQRQTAVRFRHEGSIADKLEDARRALGLFDKARSRFAEQLRVLNAKEMDREAIQRFWLEVYTTTIDEIPSHPATKQEVARVEQAKQTLASWGMNFDQERVRLHTPASAWTALNAATRWMDHQRRVRAANDTVRNDSRVFSNWWGVSAAAKHKALSLALSR